ncbi:hypothetical protein FB567DRAFT_516875 [Paraphoma chrysanthemicola]|uniref:Rhodopsin domain-containing protein n=1 Tax=Paraphoma chrysanthemicola TaxID=798071 RepID=A0A8K0W1W8_9PLEO|nr:hypothetical protein FB567DRAFT_516875 [Paraphoma chrysanthemicola]
MAVAKTPLALGITFPILAIIAVLARFWARRKKRMSWRIDDWMLIPSLVLSIANAISMIIAATDGDMGQMKPLDKHGLPPLDKSFKIFYKCIYANKLLTTTAIAATRYAVLLFYGRIFRGRLFNVSVWILYIINGAWGIAYTFLFIFTCRPISDGWKSPTGSKDRNCLPLSTVQSNAYTSLIIDVSMLIIPWAPIMRLKMSRKEKAMVLGIFGLGFVVVIVAVGKLVEFYIVSDRISKSHQIQYELAPTMYWTIPETCIAVVGACLPTLRPLFYGWSPESIIGSVRSALSLNSLSSRRSRQVNTTSDPSRTSGPNSIRGLRDSEEQGIPPVPPLDRSKAQKKHLESQSSVISADDGY